MATEKQIDAAAAMCKKRGVKRELAGDYDERENCWVGSGFEYPPQRTVLLEIIDAVLAVPADEVTQEQLALRLHQEHCRKEGIDPTPLAVWSAGMKAIWMGHAETCLKVFAPQAKRPPSPPAVAWDRELAEKLVTAYYAENNKDSNVTAINGLSARSAGEWMYEAGLAVFGSAVPCVPDERVFQRAYQGVFFDESGRETLHRPLDESPAAKETARAEILRRAQDELAAKEAELKEEREVATAAVNRHSDTCDSTLADLRASLDQARKDNSRLSDLNFELKRRPTADQVFYDLAAFFRIQGESHGRELAAVTQWVLRALRREVGCLADRAALQAIHILAAQAVMTTVEVDPGAPMRVTELPDFWDERRKRQGKPDLSRCGAELRRALNPSFTDKIENFAAESVKTPEHGAVTSRHSVGMAADVRITPAEPKIEKSPLEGIKSDITMLKEIVKTITVVLLEAPESTLADVPQRLIDVLGEAARKFEE